MKTLFALLMLWPLLAQSQMTIRSPFYSAALRGTAAGGAPVYFLSEDFEAPGYENIWTNYSTGAGVVNDKYATAPAPLSNNYSLCLKGSAVSLRATNYFSGTYPIVSGYMLFNHDQLENQITFLSMLNDDAGTRSNVFRIMGRGTTNGLLVYHGSKNVTLQSSSLTPGTTYHLWFKYAACSSGSTSNGFADVALLPTTSGTSRPTSGLYLSLTNGDAVGGASLLVLGATTSAMKCTNIHDRIRLSTNNIPTAP